MTLEPIILTDRIKPKRFVKLDKALFAIAGCCALVPMFWLGASHYTGSVPASPLAAYRDCMNEGYAEMTTQLGERNSYREALFHVFERVCGDRLYQALK